MLRQANCILPIRASRPGLHEFTNEVLKFVADSGIADGLLTLFCRHTSASLVIQENAAPAAKRDLEAYFEAGLGLGSRERTVLERRYLEP